MSERMHHHPLVDQDFLDAVRRAAEALREAARRVERTPQYSEPGDMGDLLRQGVEKQRRDAALLEDWVKRESEARMEDKRT